MLRNSTLLLGFCALAAVAAFFLQPSPAARVEATIAQLEPEVALARLEQQATQGTLDRNLGMMLANLALRAGHLNIARTVLENQREETSFEVAAEVLLSEVAQMSGDMAGAAQHLQIAYRIEPTLERRLTLGAWYRLLRDPEAELGILQSVPPIRLSAWEAERLLDLTQEGRRFEVLESLIKTLARQDGEAAYPHRARLINYLIDAGRAESALVEMWRWYSDKGDVRELSMPLKTLIDRGAIGEASAVAMRALAENPEKAHVLIPVFAQSGHGAVARGLQDFWLAGGSEIGDDGWRTLIDLAEFTGDLRSLRTELMGGSKDLPSQAVLADALGQVLRYQGSRALTPFRRLLSGSLLEHAPLIGAAMSADQGRDGAVFSYLVAAADRPMRDWERSVWLSLAERLNGKPAYRALLDAAPSDQALRAALGHKFIAATSRFEAPSPPTP